MQIQFTIADGVALKEDTDTYSVSKGDIITIRIQEISSVHPGGNVFYSIWLNFSKSFFCLDLGTDELGLNIHAEFRRTKEQSYYHSNVNPRN